MILSIKADKEDSIMKIGFLGDTNFSGCYKNTNEFPVSEEVLAQLKTVDFLVANLEGPLLAAESLKYGGKPVGSPKEKANSLNLLGIHFLNLANNHTMDAGERGLLETLNILKTHGVGTFGAGKNLYEAVRPLILEMDEVRVALVGISMHEGQLASEKAAGIFGEKQIEELKKILSLVHEEVDYTVLCHHGGIEYTHYPDPVKRGFYHKLLRMGVDAIIGTHPHTVQSYEVVGGVPIFYSLGNFIFDHPTHKYYPGTDESLLLILDFAQRNVTFEVFPLRQDFVQQKVIIDTLPAQFQDLKKINYDVAWDCDAKRLVNIKLKIPSRFPLPIAKGFRVLKMMKNRNQRHLLFK